MKQIRYVITNEKEDKFYKMGEYYRMDILNCLYVSKEMAEYHLTRCLNPFQKYIFTKIITVKITVEKVE